MLEEFSTLHIEPPPPLTDASPQERSRLAELPEEILTNILTGLAVTDVASFVRMALVCKRLAYLVYTEESIWKTVATGHEFGFAAMHYDFACDIEGFTLEANDEIARYLGSYDEQDEETEDPPLTPEERQLASAALTEQLLQTTYSSSWRQMFRLRPRIRFNGCYISTVNYTRAGGTFSNTLSWGAPVHVVTYFRYLRFFRDGTCISLLTTAEPADVVHHLTKDNLHNHHTSNQLPSSVMKDALRGRWRLTGPASLALDVVTMEMETEGDVVIETEGVVPKYTYKLVLTLAHAGKGARNNKLAWKWFGSHNRLTDDWGEFGLRNDRAFYWSRVRSYGTGL
jgi:F-box protein 9